MFNSMVLDFAAGLIFTFLGASLATGAIVEAISSLLAVRARTLRKGIGQLLNDPKYSALAKELYSHAAVNPRSDGTAKSISVWNRKNPAYIDRQLFGQAMLDVLKISPQIAAAPGAMPTVAALTTAVDGATADPQLRQLLHGIIERSLGDPDKIKGEMVAWFDNAMDRVSGWYKRWTQLISFIVALILAVGLNIDAAKIAATLWTQPKLAEELTKNLPAGSSAATSPAERAAPTTAESGGAAAGKVASPGAGNPKTEESPTVTLHRLDTTLPVGWPQGFWSNERGAQLSFDEFGIALLGWSIVALSTLFGAPFWFDLLQTVIRLKGAGPSPKERVDGKGAAA